MEVIKEIEAMRKRMIQEINTEFDRLIERISSEYAENWEFALSAEGIPYETKYPLAAGAKIFKGTKPNSVIFQDDTRIHVSTWKQVVAAVMEHCLDDKNNKDALKALSDNISGKKRLLLSKTGTSMRSPLKLCEGLYMETHYDTETLLNVLTIRILGAIQYDYSNIQVTIRNR